VVLVAEAIAIQLPILELSFLLTISFVLAAPSMQFPFHVAPITDKLLFLSYYESKRKGVAVIHEPEIYVPIREHFGLEAYFFVAELSLKKLGQSWNVHLDA
jgi:hypothetical protein